MVTFPSLILLIPFLLQVTNLISSSLSFLGSFFKNNWIDKWTVLSVHLSYTNCSMLHILFCTLLFVLTMPLEIILYQSIRLFLILFYTTPLYGLHFDTQIIFYMQAFKMFLIFHQVQIMMNLSLWVKSNIPSYV